MQPNETGEIRARWADPAADPVAVAAQGRGGAYDAAREQTRADVATLFAKLDHAQALAVIFARVVAQLAPDAVQEAVVRSGVHLPEWSAALNGAAPSPAPAGPAAGPDAPPSRPTLVVAGVTYLRHLPPAGHAPGVWYEDLGGAWLRVPDEQVARALDAIVAERATVAELRAALTERDDADPAAPCPSCGALPDTQHSATCFYMLVQVDTAGDLAAARRLYDETRTTLARAETDTARLDWLDAHAWQLSRHDGTLLAPLWTAYEMLDGEHTGRSLPEYGPPCEGDDVREAIDNARGAARAPHPGAEGRGDEGEEAAAERALDYGLQSTGRRRGAAGGADG